MRCRDVASLGLSRRVGKEHYDLTAILEHDWSTLGPKLQAKLRVHVGSPGTYFLTDAVYYLEHFLNSTKNPPYDGEVKYGDRAEHCWNGDPDLPNYLSRLHYHTMHVPKILERVQKKQPRLRLISLPGDTDRRKTE